MQIALQPRIESADLDETAGSSPGERHRRLRRAIRSVASRLGKLREDLRQGAFAPAGISRDHVDRWIEAIDQMLLDFDELPGGFLTPTLADRISGFLTLAEEVLDRLEAAGSASCSATGRQHELSLH